MIPASTKILGFWLADDERGFAAALGSNAGIPIGVFISSPFIGWLLADFSRQAVFIGTGLLAVILALIWIAYYRGLGAHLDSNEAERRFLTGNIIKISSENAVQCISRCMLHRNRNIQGMSLSEMASLFSLYLLLTWLPTYLIQQHHLSILHSGIYGSIPWVFGLLGVVVGGKSSDAMIKTRLTNRKGTQGVYVIRNGSGHSFADFRFRSVVDRYDRLPVHHDIRHPVDQQHCLGGECRDLSSPTGRASRRPEELLRQCWMTSGVGFSRIAAEGDRFLGHANGCRGDNRVGRRGNLPIHAF